MNYELRITDKIPNKSTVWLSHGDTVTKLPKGFTVIGSTDRVKNAFVGNIKKKYYGVQFHPEMYHTQYGTQIFMNFVSHICGMVLKPTKIDVQAIIRETRKKVGSSIVVGAFSGGTDSVVAGVITAKAIGRRFKPIYIDSGLMRVENTLRIKEVFPAILGCKIKIVTARQKFLSALKGITDPEAKRKTIGKLYIRLFEQEAKKYPKAKFLLQGTTYADFIHSKGTKKSAYIKSHHNVGGLPKKMKLKLLEPLRYFYTDQVRQIGALLKLPKDVIYQQPFPGPGHAVRIVGEVTPERLIKQAQADMIVVDELRKNGWYDQVFQCWSIMTGANSTAIKGDSRFFGEVVAIRIIQSKDRMTADWVRLPGEVLDHISTRIVNEVPEISRVVYDITTKPPATMEWE